MKFTKFFTIITVVLIFTLLVGCATPDTTSDITSNDSKSSSLVEMPDIVSLDKKMANYFDISLFDEENYANIYLGRNFDIIASYNQKELIVPTNLEALNKIGFNIAKGSEYNANSYIYAKETITLKFDDETTSITAQFYNSSNSSKRLNKCKISKIRIENTENTPEFNVNGINNNSTVIDVIDTLGTPSHFYAVTDDNYYFDYFISKNDRRNKIRVFVDLINDCVTAVEFSNYK